MSVDVVIHRLHYSGVSPSFLPLLLPRINLTSSHNICDSLNKTSCMYMIVSPSLFYSIQALSDILPLRVPLASTPHFLVIFDGISSIPLTPFYTSLLKNTNTHIVVTHNATSKPKDLIKTIDHELLRGTNMIDLKPLSPLHATQRLVHAIMKGCDTDDFVPYNEEQKMLSLITDNTGGSPDVVDVAATVCADRLSHGDTDSRRSVLEELCKNILKRQDSETSSEASEPRREEEEEGLIPLPVVAVESTASNKTPDEERFPLNTISVLGFTINLLKYLNLSQSVFFLLMSLQWFGPIPIPRELIEILQSLIMSANKDQSPSSKTPFDNLLSVKLLRVFPSTVIVQPATSKPLPASLVNSYPSATTLSYIQDSNYYYVPQLVCDAVRNQMKQIDKDFSLATVLKALQLYSKESRCDLTHAAGLANVLSEVSNENVAFFQEVYRLSLSLSLNAKAKEQPLSSDSS